MLRIAALSLRRRRALAAFLALCRALVASGNIDDDITLESESECDAIGGGECCISGCCKYSIVSSGECDIVGCAECDVVGCGMCDVVYRELESIICAYSVLVVLFDIERTLV